MYHLLMVNKSFAHSKTSSFNETYFLIELIYIKKTTKMSKMCRHTNILILHAFSNKEVLPNNLSPNNHSNNLWFWSIQKASWQWEKDTIDCMHSFQQSLILFFSLLKTMNLSSFFIYLVLFTVFSCKCSIKTTFLKAILNNFSNRKYAKLIRSKLRKLLK